MALPTTLGPGGTGWHGDDAVQIRASLKRLRTLANELKADHNDVLAKLDADTGVTAADHVATVAVAAADVAAISEELASGGAYAHGDAGIKTRTAVTALRTLLNELKADHNALLAKLDADATVADSDYAATLAVAADEVGAINVETTVGAARLAGDEGVELRSRIQGLVTLANELRTDRNALVTKLDADAGVADANYASLHTTSAAVAS